MPAPAPATTPDASRTAFLASLRRALEHGRFRKLVLASPTVREGDVATRIDVRAIAWRGAPALSFCEHHATRDVTRNLVIDEGLERLEGLIASAYARAHLLTMDGEAELRRSRRGTFGLSRRMPENVAPAAASTDAERGSAATFAPHDRVKRRWVDVTRRWLVDLGVTDAEARVIPSMARKWKQIDKFVEIVDHAIATSPLRDRERVHVIDFGAGKGYLTFAVHDHLLRALGKEAEVLGVERRSSLVEAAQAAAQRHAMSGLRFETGDITTVALERADIVIALHACDTATDEALHRGVRAGAAILIASPCCHQQLRTQILPPALLKPMLRHGIHLGQEAEMVTDALRALLLEREGYATRVFEFVSLEHTSKNKMILAVRREQPPDRAALDAEIAALESFYGVREQRLQSLLAA